MKLESRPLPGRELGSICSSWSLTGVWRTRRWTVPSREPSQASAEGGAPENKQNKWVRGGKEEGQCLSPELPGHRGRRWPAALPGRAGVGGELPHLPWPGGGPGSRDRRRRGDRPPSCPAMCLTRPRRPLWSGRRRNSWAPGRPGVQRRGRPAPAVAYRHHGRAVAPGDGGGSGRGVLHPAGGGPRLCPPAAGAIVTVSSMWGVTGGSCEVAYSAAKAGVIGLTKALARSWGPPTSPSTAWPPGSSTRR